MVAAIYARKSTEQNVADDQKSIVRQVEHARAYAVRKGWTIDDAYVFADDGISGAEFAKRPGFLRLMNALKPRPAFQVLVMSEESRLGRESIETAYALKQLVRAGVRVFFYLEDRERILDSPTDKIMLSLQTFADELEREKTRQRTYDAMARKARAGHVTGGRVFGYDNVEVLGPDGRRSHVERCINELEASVVRRIFDLRAGGVGQVRIAHVLNAEGGPMPRPRGAGRPTAWAPSSVREVLFRELYRGVIVWNRKRKRNQWGQEQHSAKPEAEWLRVPAPTLRLVSDETWRMVHERLNDARREYDRTTDGRRRPRRDRESRYLMVGFGRCATCGGGLCVQSRSKGRHGRALYYRCTSNLQRGTTVCRHSQLWPMEAIDDEVLKAIGGEALAPEVIEEIVTEARVMFEERSQVNPRPALEQELERLASEQERLVDAVAAGGTLGALVSRLEATERRRFKLTEALQATIETAAPPAWRQIERYVRQSLAEWRVTLAGDVEKVRGAFRKLLAGPIVFTPFTDGQRRGIRFEGRIGLAAVLGEFVATSMVTRAGIEPATL